MNRPNDPLPDNGLIIARGTFSGGKPIAFKKGDIREINSSIAPEALNIPMATRIAMRYGIIRTAISKPSFAPSTNDS